LGAIPVTFFGTGWDFKKSQYHKSHPIRSKKIPVMLKMTDNIGTEK